MKAPSTKILGSALAFALLGVAVVLLGTAQSATPLHAGEAPLPDEVATSLGARSSVHGPIEPAREVAVPPPVEPVPRGAPPEALSEAQILELRCEFWRDMSVALERLAEANEMLHLSRGSEVAFRRLLQDYVQKSAAMGRLLVGDYEVVDRREVYRVMTETSTRDGQRFASTIGGVGLLMRLETPSHPLQRHANEPPDDVVFALRRHLIDAFNALPPVTRRTMLEADAAARAQMAAPSQLSTAAVRKLESQLLQGDFRRLMVGWMLAER